MEEKIKKVMNKSETINWGILGTARIARKRMIKAIQETDENACLAIASRNEKRAEEAAGNFGIPRYYGSYDELIADDEIDAVYIPLPNSLHHSWTLRAAEKGKHILCEKPLGLSVSQVEEMVRICEEHNVLLMEAHSYFLHPQYVKLFKLLAEEIIGHVRQIQVHFSYPAGKEHAIRFECELGGGSLLDIGCYGIDLVNRIYEQNPLDMKAIFNMDNKIDMEFLGLLKFPGNKEATIRTSFRQERQQTLLVCGEKGNIFLSEAFIPAGNNSYLFIKSPGGVEIEEIQNVDQYGLLVREFREQVLSKKSPGIHCERYVKNARILESLLKLQDSGD